MCCVHVGFEFLLLLVAAFWCSCLVLAPALHVFSECCSFCVVLLVGLVVCQGAHGWCGAVVEGDFLMSSKDVVCHCSNRFTHMFLPRFFFAGLAAPRCSCLGGVSAARSCSVSTTRLLLNAAGRFLLLLLAGLVVSRCSWQVWRYGHLAHSSPRQQHTWASGPSAQHVCW
jgi:hypothetical protein